MESKIHIQRGPKKRQVRNKMGLMLSKLIGGFVAILIGLSLLPGISNQVNLAQNQVRNVTNGDMVWGAEVLKLIPGFFALAILGIGLVIIFGALKSAGLIGRRRDVIDKSKLIITYPHQTALLKEELKKSELKKQLEKYEYDSDTESSSKSNLEMSEEQYNKKKEEYDAKMKKFREKKRLSEKDLEKYDYSTS